MSGVLAIDDARVLTPSGVVAGHVLVDAGRVVDVAPGSAPAGATRIDVAGAWVAPGFIDLQINGGYGIDLTTEPERATELGTHLVRHGVTAFLPTIITAPADRRAAALAVTLSDAGRAARPLGWHFEGPMISPARLGAHPAGQIAAPSPAVIDGWDAGAGVALVTLAPELPGALDTIAALRSRGVVVSIGHTDCDAATFAAARAAGASFVTHLFNAMRPFVHRDPGPIGAALADPAVVCGLIADGVHVDPVAVAMAVRALGVDRVALVTDAVAAMAADPPSRAGAPSGRQGGRHAPERLGEVDIVVGAGAVRTPGGVLAGSVCPLDEALRNLITFTELDLPAAVRTVTSTPAAVLGRDDLGVVAAGARADLTVLDDDANVEATIVGGEVAWRS